MLDKTNSPLVNEEIASVIIYFESITFPKRKFHWNFFIKTLISIREIMKSKSATYHFTPLKHYEQYLVKTTETALQKSITIY